MSKRLNRTIENKIINRAARHVINRRAFAKGTALAAASAMGTGTFSAIAKQDSEPTPGGRIILGLIQEPGQLNAFFNGQSGSFISRLTVDPLFVANTAGEYLPVLAAEIPTLENGGLSDDFLTVTYRLKEGITWSDGEPFTADDMVFTWEVYQNPESTPSVGSEYSLIESVSKVDDYTVEVKMNQINPMYLELWDSIQPKHKFESSAVTLEHEVARIPLGTGPFVISEWKTGDEITLDRNTNYREDGKPYLDGITIKITPQKDAAIASFINGDLDYLYFIVTGDLPLLTEASENGDGVTVWVDDGGTSVEWLWLNNTTPGDPSQPHPVLGDKAIREAMDYGIDRQTIIDEVLGGFGTLETSFIFAGWAAVDTEPTPFDPDKAQEVLDAAGWEIGDGGIREKDGVRASLRYQTIAGDQSRELYQQVVQQNMKNIGIELNIENVPSNTIFGSYQEGGLRKRGEFDILMSRAGYEIDPFDWVSMFTTAEISSEDNPTGSTYTYYSNPEVDALAQEALTTLDQQARMEIYQQIAEIVNEDRPAIALYRSAKAEAWRDHLKGVNPDFFRDRGAIFSAADWYLEQE